VGLSSGGGPPCAALERREFQKVTLGNSYWTRESQYDIGVGLTNEMKHFLVFLIRKAQSHTLTEMVGTTSALRRSNEQQFSALLYLE
jgi:hypothetical protein